VAARMASASGAGLPFRPRAPGLRGGRGAGSPR
jgi:hypothetical protein